MTNLDHVQATLNEINQHCLLMNPSLVELVQTTPDLIREIETLRVELAETQEREAFHPRAAKLARKQKPFIVVAIDESYFPTVYEMIRKFEKVAGRWTEDDENQYATLLDANRWIVQDRRMNQNKPQPPQAQEE
jgi:hypothetical protein